MTSFKRSISVFSSCFSVLLISACGGGGGGESSRQNLSLNFRAQDGQVPVSCGSILSGLGPDRQDSVSLNDLRFYISNVHFFDAQGQELISEAIPSEFQLIDSDGAVGLIDLTNNSDGACSSVNFAGAEGTQRTNASLTFSVESGQVATVRFDVGVPQRLMKKVLNTFTTEGAPSPLGEMYWTWASGYRHLVMNFLIQGGRGSIGEGYLHLGSRDCGGDGNTALTDRDYCGFINTPTVALTNFNPATDTVSVDVRRALQGLSFVTTLYDSNPPYNPVGQGLGMACHSAPVEQQPDCGPVFANFGLSASDGSANSSANTVFQKSS